MVHDVVEIVQELFATYSLALENGAAVHWGLIAYIVLALLVLVEGPVATLLGAAAASAGFMNPVLVFAAASIGNLTADMLWYRLGYLGKMNWLLKLGRFVDIRAAHIERLRRDMNEHAQKLLVIAKLSVSLSIPALVATGVAKVPWRKWFVAVFLTEMAWTGMLVAGGVQFARMLPRLETWLQVLAVLMVVLFLSLVGRYIYRAAQVWSDLPSLREGGSVDNS